MPWQDRSREEKRKADARYNAEYRRKREACLRFANWRCQLRLDGCQGSASEVDHILGADADPHHNALRAVCRSCHGRRTAQQGRGWRRGGQVADPDPEPRTSWWQPPTSA